MLRRLTVVVFFLLLSGMAHSQNAGAKPDTPKDQSFQTKLQQAHTLYELGRITEALPLYEDLVKQKPDSIPALEGYAMTLLMSGAVAKDDAEKRRVRVEARKLLLKATDVTVHLDQ